MWRYIKAHWRGELSLARSYWMLMVARLGVAVGDAGTIVRSTDPAGEVWAKVAAPTTENLRGVHFWDGQSGWAVGDAGTILHTDDGGKTWSKPDTIYEGAAQTLFQLLTDGTRVFLVWHGGAPDETGIYFNSSPDGGATWSRPFDAPARLWFGARGATVARKSSQIKQSIKSNTYNNIYGL